MKIDIKLKKAKKLCFARESKIISMGVGFPEKIVPNQELIDKYGLIASDRAVVYSIGIKERRWANDEETLEKLIAKSIRECLGKAKISINQVDRIIYTKLLGQYQVPAISLAVLRELNADVGVPTMDLTCACSGFVQALDIALRCVDNGEGYVLVVGGGITSDAIRKWGKPNPKSVFLFGDGVSSMLVGYSKKKQFMSSYIFTNPYLYDNAYVPFGTSMIKGDIAEFDYDSYNMRIVNGDLILKSSILYARYIYEKLLESSDLKFEDINYFITSDQSTRIWEAQLEELGFKKEQSISMFEKFGNTVAAMSPINLYYLLESGKVKDGDLVMFQAHGAGATSGGVIIKI